MENGLEEKTYKNLEQTKNEVKSYSVAGNSAQYLCYLFAALGIISDILNFKVLEPTSWFLLSIVAALIGIIYRMHTEMTRHLLYSEVEIKTA